VMVGDAELDEGNVGEALAEEALARLTNVLWIVDVNRQSLDRIVPDGRLRQTRAMFEASGWRVDELRWGGRLRALFEKPGGDRLRRRLDAMPNVEYQRLLRTPAGAVRKALVTGSRRGAKKPSTRVGCPRSTRPRRARRPSRSRRSSTRPIRRSARRRRRSAACSAR